MHCTPALKFSEVLLDAITVLLVCEFSNQVKVYKSQELQKRFSKTVKTSNQKGAVKNKLQLKNFIYIDPLAKYFLTEMDVQDQFLSRVDREIKKGIFVVNDQWSTMLGQLWLLIFLILE